MFGVILKNLRENAGWYQSDLAKKLGISPSTVGMYEIGSRTPNLEMLIKIAKLFNVSADYLLGLTSQPNSSLFDGPVINHVSMKKGYALEDMSEHDKNIIRDIVISTLQDINNEKNKGK